MYPADDRLDMATWHEQSWMVLENTGCKHMNFVFSVCNKNALLWLLGAQ